MFTNNHSPYQFKVKKINFFRVLHYDAKIQIIIYTPIKCVKKFIGFR